MILLLPQRHRGHREEFIAAEREIIFGIVLRISHFAFRISHYAFRPTHFALRISHYAPRAQSSKFKIFSCSFLIYYKSGKYAHLFIFVFAWVSNLGLSNISDYYHRDTEREIIFGIALRSMNNQQLPTTNHCFVKILRQCKHRG